MGSAFCSEPQGWMDEARRRAERVVLCVLSEPDLVLHDAYPECHIELPHHIDDCGVWLDELGQQRRARGRARRPTRRASSRCWPE